MYKPNNFELYELVSPWMYERKGEFAWAYLSPSTLKFLQALRDEFGAITVNDWKWGGEYEQSGLRDFGFYLQMGYTLEDAHEGISESGSLHKYGLAFDGKPKEWSAEEIRDMLRTKEYWKYFSDKYNIDFQVRFENRVSWLHFDTPNYEVGGGTPYFFDP